MAKAGGTKRASYRHGDLPAALTDGVLALVAERGVKNFSVAEAARRAGVSKGAPYRHFATREDLLFAVAEKVYSQLIEELRVAREGRSDGIEQLAELAAAFVRFACRNSPGVEVVFGAGLQKPTNAALQDLNVQAYGEFRLAADRIVSDPERAHRLVIGAAAVAHGINMLILDGSLSAVGFSEEVATNQARENVRWMALGARGDELEVERPIIKN